MIRKKAPPRKAPRLALDTTPLGNTIGVCNRDVVATAASICRHFCEPGRQSTVGRGQKAVLLCDMTCFLFLAPVAATATAAAKEPAAEPLTTTCSKVPDGRHMVQLNVQFREVDIANEVYSRFKPGYERESLTVFRTWVFVVNPTAFVHNVGIKFDQTTRRWKEHGWESES